ncbi:MAG: SGNH/GDSL hydrolase family protein, partial [Phycisphaerae bacterium]|nr:SGNH/GDSL hydrolase family protein [Phycisphaerae bacterium]
VRVPLGVIDVNRSCDVKSETPPCDDVSVQSDTGPDLKWFDVRQIGVEGKGWTETKRFYDRLPARAKGKVTEKLWQRSRSPAGMIAHFTTDAEAVHARWEYFPDDQAADTGGSRLDLYARNDSGQWRWLGVGKSETPGMITAMLVEGLKPARREFMLYLPLGAAVKSVEIGVDKPDAFEPIAPRTEKPIIFYGTSIVHGECASRPGMAYPAILGRKLNKPVINLGFGGSAHSEPELAELLAELEGCAYVIDPLANMSAEIITERIEPFVSILRQARPDTPIVLVGEPGYPHALFVASVRKRLSDNRAALRAAYDRLVATGTDRLHYIPGDDLYGHDGEATVDGIHPSDAGFLRMADVFESILETIL